jgi:hypothetical protein
MGKPKTTQQVIGRESGRSEQHLTLKQEKVQYRKLIFFSLERESLQSTLNLELLA